MPLRGYKCGAVLKTGRNKCSFDECLATCLTGQGCEPATFIKTLSDNVQAYTNRGTISGSSLESPCDGQSVLERILDYHVAPESAWYAGFRGSLVHDALENHCKNDPRFDSWLIESRFFATLSLDDEIEALPVPLKEDGSEDWGVFANECDELRRKGFLILSGQIDSYEGITGILYDNKTSAFATDKPKDGWLHQLNMYRLLMELHGYKVNKIEVIHMDASKKVQCSIPMFREDWVKDFMIPRCRELDALSKIDNIDDAYEHCKVGYLCNGKNKQGEIYCSVADQCPARRDWLEGNA